ncbi:Histone acetyl transferase HAT1 N-terminal [Dillenia turbinata]|uniref:histone acetyltransferase n=1 Tax=Dillenia turbinata TaxID=194707 RepID=A0AAN8ZP22_9MAGN
MGQKKQGSDSDQITEPKKRRRVGFAVPCWADCFSSCSYGFDVDASVEANHCIKIYLVSSKEEVDAPNTNTCVIDPVDLNQFFGEDGKIYGYQGLKITVWISSISFHVYADITFESTSDGGKGITNLKPGLQDIFAENLVDSKDDFLQTFSTESQCIKYGFLIIHANATLKSSHIFQLIIEGALAVDRSIISKGEIMHQKPFHGQISNLDKPLEGETSELQVARLVVSNMSVGHLYSRLVPLVLLLVDGSTPIDVTDPKWELYVVTEKQNDQQGDSQCRLLGFTAIYRFYHYPDTSRMRLGQILVLPPYQHKGFGRYLLEVLNTVAIAEDVYDLTMEEPLDYLQQVRTCIDILRLLEFSPIEDAVKSAITCLKQGKLSKKVQPPRLAPPSTAVENVRKSLKINKKQFLQCWEILIYLGLNPTDKYMENFTEFISNRMKAEFLGRDSENAGKRVIDVRSDYNSEMSFVLFKTQSNEGRSIELNGSETNQEDQLRQLVDERIKEIKLIAEKVSLQRA